MNKDLACVIPAVTTPLQEDGSFDPQGMRNLVRNMVESGMKTLFLLGFAGESQAFSREQRREIIRTVREAVADDVKIIAGVFDNATELIHAHVCDARTCGADYVLAPPTNFYPLRDCEIERLFTDIAERSPLPLIIYNCPLNRHYIPGNVVARLAVHPNIAGIKQTSDLWKVEQMQLAVRGIEGFTLLSGDEFAYFGAMAMGVEGFIMGGPGNVFPKKCVRIFENFKRGKFAEARDEYAKMIDFLFELYALPFSEFGAVKGMLELSGICNRWVHKPVFSPTDEEMKIVRSLMQKHQVALD